MKPEELRFESGGVECAAWLFRPPAAADSAAPCVVLGTGASCVYDQGLALYAERFAEAGFAALAFDYRCFGRSGGEPRGLLLAGRQRDDFRAAIRLARSLERVDGERIALWGYSLGGGNVQALLIDEPEIAAVAVCVAPVVSGLRSLLHMGGPRHVLRLAAAGLRDGARALRGAEPWRVPATGPPGSRGLLNSPDSLPGFEAMTPADSSWRNALCARAALAPPYRLERKIRRIACPILYCIAEDDDVNPPELGKRAAERAPGGELKLYPGGHYDPFQGETLDRMAYDQIGFLRRALAG